jgi:hypothetical protein
MAIQGLFNHANPNSPMNVMAAYHCGEREQIVTQYRLNSEQDRNCGLLRTVRKHVEATKQQYHDEED